MSGSESDLLIVVALRPEARAVLRALPQPKRLRGAGITLWQSRPGQGRVWLLRTGVGPARAAPSVSRALALIRRPEAVLDLGCAGGLVEALPSGAAVAASIVRDCEGNSWPADPRWASLLRAAARRGGVACSSGVLLSSPVALRTREEKSTAAARHGAVCVSMETAAVARMATAARIPFASLRVVLDELNTDLQGGGTALVDADGRPLLGALLRHPLAALGLARAMHDVECVLQTAVTAFLEIHRPGTAGAGTIPERGAAETELRRRR